MGEAPGILSQTYPDGVSVALSGDWTIEAGAGLERESEALVRSVLGAARAVLDISEVGALDTAGAWIIDRSRQALVTTGVHAELIGVRPEHATLLREARFRQTEAPPPRHSLLPLALIGDVGESVYIVGKDLLGGLDFLGRLVAVSLPAVLDPRRWRFTSFVHHLEAIALRGAPIIIMINFFVGAIVAEQGIIQLSRFGAAAYTVDLVGILTLRELGVLLTSIMVAGRSGSAITAELGSMKMREEIDALRVMALDPLEVLILPRLAALVIALPALTFLGDLAAILGGMLVTWFYGGVTPTGFLTELQYPVGLHRFEVGLIKAPFMALVIGIIAAAEGFAVGGSAESLGKQVTSSVVKSIFTVIVLDGFFAIFFAAVGF